MNIHFALACRGAVRGFVVSGALACAALASAQQPAAPVEPLSPDERRAAECLELSGLERSECLRRDVTTEEADAGTTTSMQVKEQARERAAREARIEAAAAREARAATQATRTPPASEAEQGADAAGPTPAPSSSRLRQAADSRPQSAQGEQNEAADEAEDTAVERASDSRTDTLEPGGK